MAGGWKVVRCPTGKWSEHFKCIDCQKTLRFGNHAGSRCRPCYVYFLAIQRELKPVIHAAMMEASARRRQRIRDVFCKYDALNRAISLQTPVGFNEGHLADVVADVSLDDPAEIAAAIESVVARLVKMGRTPDEAERIVRAAAGLT